MRAEGRGGREAGKLAWGTGREGERGFEKEAGLDAGRRKGAREIAN